MYFDRVAYLKGPLFLWNLNSHFGVILRCAILLRHFIIDKIVGDIRTVASPVLAFARCSLGRSVVHNLHVLPVMRFVYAVVTFLISPVMAFTPVPR